MDMMEQLSRIGIVPVIAINDAADAVPLAQALIDGGLPCAEVTFRTAAAADAMRIVSRMVLVPSERALVSGSTEQSQLAAKLTHTQPSTTGFFFDGGMMIAKNIPNSATESALTRRAGRMLPAVTPSAVPMAQPGMAGRNAP